MSEDEGAAVEAPAQPEPASTGRGRPRPDGTIERDKAVLAHISANGAKTRSQLVEEMGIPGNQVYLSLYRLSRQDPPAVVKNGAQWSVPGAEAPAAAEAEAVVTVE